MTPSLSHPEFDVVVCGGTLGIFIAATLQQRGHTVKEVWIMGEDITDLIRYIQPM